MSIFALIIGVFSLLQGPIGIGLVVGGAAAAGLALGGTAGYMTLSKTERTFRQEVS